MPLFLLLLHLFTDNTAISADSASFTKAIIFFVPCVSVVCVTGRDKEKEVIVVIISFLICPRLLC